MTTVISYSNSAGEHRRCDANCHDASKQDCSCICGGMNHGGGLQQAVANTCDWAAKMVEQADMPAENKTALLQLVTRDSENAPLPTVDYHQVGQRPRRRHRKAKGQTQIPQVHVFLPKPTPGTAE